MILYQINNIVGVVIGVTLLATAAWSRNDPLLLCHFYCSKSSYFIWVHLNIHRSSIRHQSINFICNAVYPSFHVHPHSIYCVCVTGHRSVEYVRIIRRWSSNLRHWPLQNLGSIAYCCVFIIDPPRPIQTPSDILLGGEGSPLLTQNILHQYPYYIWTGSYSHLGDTCIHTSIMILLS